jgi:hypothetical protein
MSDIKNNEKYAISERNEKTDLDDPGKGQL